jgi:hypothetical protein
MNHAGKGARYIIDGSNIITCHSSTHSPHLQTINTYLLIKCVDEEER